MEESKSGLYIVAIVAVIAVVALVVLVTGQSRSIVIGETATTLDADSTGQASRGVLVNKPVTGTVVSKALNDGEEHCYCSNGGICYYKKGSAVPDCESCCRV